MYTLYVNDVPVKISDFSESLNQGGTVSLNVSNSTLEGNNSFKGLSALRDATKRGAFPLKIVAEDEVIVLQGNNYSLQSASFSANSNGLYFSAYFVETEPAAPVSEELESGFITPTDHL